MAGIEELPEGEDVRDAEFPDEDQGEGGETWPCPHCGRSMHLDSPRCPHCGDYVTPGEASPRKELIPWWVWLGLALLAVAVIGILASR